MNCLNLRRRLLAPSLTCVVRPAIPEPHCDAVRPQPPVPLSRHPHPSYTSPCFGDNRFPGSYELLCPRRSHHWTCRCYHVAILESGSIGELPAQAGLAVAGINACAAHLKVQNKVQIPIRVDILCMTSAVRLRAVSLAWSFSVAEAKRPVIHA